MLKNIDIAKSLIERISHVKKKLLSDETLGNNYQLFARELFKRNLSVPTFDNSGNLTGLKVGSEQSLFNEVRDAVVIPVHDNNVVKYLRLK